MNTGRGATRREDVESDPGKPGKRRLHNLVAEIRDLRAMFGPDPAATILRVRLDDRTLGDWVRLADDLERVLEETP